VPPPLPSHRWLDTPEGIAELGALLVNERIIGLDTESDSMHSYFEKVCLVQIVLPGDRIFLVDPLKTRDLSALKPALEDPAIRKVLHGADYDIVCMKRDFGISLRGTFCTMTAATLLGVERFGLGDLVKRKYGVTLAKAFTTSDWAARPLSPGQVEYLVQDVQFLLGLAEDLDRDLRAKELVEEVSLEFARLEAREPTPRALDPLAWLRVKGARDLPERARSVLRSLVEVREERAREMDRPTFKVLANETLLRIAQASPLTPARLREVRGVTPYVLKRHGDAVLEAVKKGVEDPRPAPDRAPPGAPPPPEERLGFAGQRRLGLLKDWRREAAERSGFTTLAILPNPAMILLARNPPRDAAGVAAVPGVGAHRAAKWADAIVQVLQGKLVPRPGPKGDGGRGAGGRGAGERGGAQPHAEDPSAAPPAIAAVPAPAPRRDPLPAAGDSFGPPPESPPPRPRPSSPPPVPRPAPAPPPDEPFGPPPL
jgi:ribonuclease D